MIGLSTMGSISFGCALVAGRKRVPSPAAGKTALRTFAGINYQFGAAGGDWQSGAAGSGAMRYAQIRCERRVDRRKRLSHICGAGAFACQLSLLIPRRRIGAGGQAPAQAV